jgi:LysR family hydrogen peroxide-inducible transcriptional activator
MTIIQLEYFLTVANHGSFSAAAERCFVSQPSLSMQISNLEDELGAVLLDRSTKPIVPTEAGQIVLEQAKEAIASFYFVKEKMHTLKGELTGKLRLGVIPTISPFLMPKFIPEFMKRCPKVTLDIRDMFTADIIDALSRDMIDIAILSGGYQIKIAETKLFNDKLYAYVSPRNPLYSRKSILSEEIDMKQLLILSEGNCLRNQTLKLCKVTKDKIKSSYNFANSSLETLMHMVDVSSAITIIPGMAIDLIPEHKRSQIKPFGKTNAHRKISMAVGHTYVKESIINAVKDSMKAVADGYALSNFMHS